MTLSPASSPVFDFGASRTTSTRRSDPVAREELAGWTSAQLRRARDVDGELRRALLDEVVVAHLWLADSVARKFQHRGEDPDDLRQVARAGLVEACRRFDPDHGLFVAFAYPTVTGLLKRHFRDHAWSIRPPRATQELSGELWRQWPELAQSVASEPTDRQLADHLQASVDEVRRARRAGQTYKTMSLDALVDDVGSEDPDGERCEARVVVGAVWADLTGAEQELLRMRFVEERSQSEIAVVLGTNQMQVSRLLARLMIKLRELIGALDDETNLPARVA